MGVNVRRARLRIEELDNPGDWNKKVEIQRLESDDNKVGGRKNQQWVTHCKPWANIHIFTGSERFDLSQSQAELSHRIVIRFRKDITEKDRKKFRIKYQGRIFEIDYIFNVGEANRFLAIHTKERV